MAWTPQTIGFHLCMFESAYHNDHSQRLQQYMYLQNWFYMEKNDTYINKTKLFIWIKHLNSKHRSPT